MSAPTHLGPRPALEYGCVVSRADFGDGVAANRRSRAAAASARRPPALPHRRRASAQLGCRRTVPAVRPPDEGGVDDPGRRSLPRPGSGCHDDVRLCGLRVRPRGCRAPPASAAAGDPPSRESRSRPRHRSDRAAPCGRGWSAPPGRPLGDCTADRSAARRCDPALVGDQARQPRSVLAHGLARPAGRERARCHSCAPRGAMDARSAGTRGPRLTRDTRAPLRRCRRRASARISRAMANVAAQRLKYTDDPVATIAREVGYRSEYAFNRAFSRHCGHPPGRYRRIARAA
jgi:hypothetical protein